MELGAIDFCPGITCCNVRNFTTRWHDTSNIMLVKCWATVRDGGPAFTQYELVVGNVTTFDQVECQQRQQTQAGTPVGRLNMAPRKMTDAEFCCRADFVAADISVICDNADHSNISVIVSYKLSVLCFLTKVSRYCLFALQSRVVGLLVKKLCL